MSEIARATILRGPGYFVRDSVTFHTTGDIVAAPNVTTFDVATSRSGNVDKRLSDVVWPVRFTPTGEVSSGLISALYPSGYRTPVIGSSIFPATDKTLAITGVTHTSGNVFTLKNTALTRMPNLRLSAGAPLFGEAEFTGIRQDDTPWSTDGSIGAVTSNGTPASGDSDPADIPTEPYSAVWGSLLADIETESGWSVEFGLNVNPVGTDRQGTLDMTLGGVEVLAKCTPVAASLADILGNMHIQGTDMARGVTTRTRSADLVLTGTTLTVTLYNAFLATAGFRWGNTTLRQGEVGFVAQRAYATGAYGALFDIAIN